ncbi:hypothetical protein J7F01_19945 [Streptomyces sp. ISL-22]|uniref:hypothetical protein n=1 Tax=Streptomyces sp. ISL-22 TaxID=2819180 RepID=UPI001BE799AC|nr:hypothetical protein [Streptomyces sp. ISL-22]MBT2434404.1 hypothetical protein [Streptomyces sp. ISL-22]
MGAMSWSGVRQRVETLARADKAREVFGAWDKYGGTGHHFRLADPLSEADGSRPLEWCINGHSVISF